MIVTQVDRFGNLTFSTSVLFKLPQPPVVAMDFSQFNQAEQAQMSKIIEKKQVGVVMRSALAGCLRRDFGRGELGGESVERS